jgi:hypothetical protein
VTDRLALMFLAASMLGACEARQLYIAHDTVIGVNAAVNQARSSGRLMIGYDRDFITVIPKSVAAAEEGEATGTGKEAMSAIACSKVEVTGLFLTQFVEHVATGEAARNFAHSLANGAPTTAGVRAAQQFLDCFETRGAER